MEHRRRIVGIACVLQAIGCNYTEGECWRRGQGGNVGAGVGAGGASGVSVGVGVGGDVDHGSSEPHTVGEDEPVCNESELPATDGDSEKPSVEKRVVFCQKPDHGAICSERCMAKGVGCVPLALHPFKSDAGVGKLFACNTKIIGFMCSYSYPNGDSCHYFFGFPMPAWCVYTGKD